jgi:predicted nucleic acid-binding protein
VKSFIDTNVLVYAHDRADEAKHDRAIAVLADLSPSELIISTQVLNEFYVVTTRPGKELLSKAEAREIVKALSWTTVEPVDADLVRRAIDLHAAHALSYWDSLVVAAAKRAGCARILTDDLDDGTVIDGVRVENPF